MNYKAFFIDQLGRVTREKEYTSETQYGIASSVDDSGITYEEMREHIGGFIEGVTINESIYLICHEEGKIIGLPANPNLAVWVLGRSISDVIVGPVIVFRKDN